MECRGEDGNAGGGVVDAGELGRGVAAPVFAADEDHGNAGDRHTPAEFTSVEDAAASIAVLATALHRLAY